MKGFEMRGPDCDDSGPGRKRDRIFDSRLPMEERFPR